MLRKFWENTFKFNWILGLLLVLIFGIPRFIIVLQANVTGNYNLVPFLFILMMLTPIILLTKKGRKQTGIKKPDKYAWLIYSFLVGIGACIITCLVAQLLFNNSIENWYVYISKSYAVSGTALSETDRLIYFMIYAVIGMTFSPVGEELFYRGVVHDSFAVNIGHQKASFIDSAAFALTHLAHFGIIYAAGTWHFPFFAALIWVLLMFLASRLFFLCKQKTGSILGAIVCHSGFNLTMMYYIFYYIL